MNILSNLKEFNKNIEINPEKIGEPRKIISNILKNIDSQDPILIALIFVGRRLISNENLELLKGRRHRKYFGLKIKSKIIIKFGWHKIKNLSNTELLNLKNNWDVNFFETKGKYLIEKSCGVLSYDNLLYSKLKYQLFE